MTNEDGIDFSVQIQLGELYSANIKATLRRLWWFLIGAAIVIIVLCSLLVYSATHSSSTLDFDELLQVAVPLFSGILVGVVMIPIATFIIAKKRLRDPGAKEGCKYHVSNDAVQVESTLARSELRWNAFVDAREVSAAFYLYLTRDHFYVIPKRCFASADDPAMFRNILREKFPKAKSLHAV